MDEFDAWQKYNLLRNPYFTEALNIEGSLIPIETLVGREKEKQEIIANISLGGGTRFLVIGESGVGKTSLVNFVRAKARKNLFFTPINEIKIQDGWTPTQLVVDILQNLYNEIKAENIKIQDQKLLTTLEDLFELSRIVQSEDTNLDALLSLNLTQTTNIYNKLVKEIIKAGGYKGIIIHFNNIDNLDQIENYDKLFNNLRDFFQNKDSIFIFIGFELLPRIINHRQKVRQIFANIPITIGRLSLEEITTIINLRLQYTKMQDREYITPHSKDAIKLLYGLYDGNARDILNSLSTSVKNLNKSPSPTLIDATKLKEILYNVAKEKFLEQLSPTEQKVLSEIIRKGTAINSELASILKKQRQHISVYIKKLDLLGAIKLDKIEGTKRHYIPRTEALWLKFEVNLKEINEQKEKEKRKIEKFKESLEKFLP